MFDWVLNAMNFILFNARCYCIPQRSAGLCLESSYVICRLGSFFQGLFLNFFGVGPEYFFLRSIQYHFDVSPFCGLCSMLYVFNEVFLLWLEELECFSSRCKLCKLFALQLSSNYSFLRSWFCLVSHDFTLHRYRVFNQRPMRMLIHISRILSMYSSSS